MKRTDGYTQETWLAPSAGVMLGIGYTVDDDKMSAYEYLRIETRSDSLVYVAQPQGQSPGIEFYLSDLNIDTALFENPKNDFPKWIRYDRIHEESCLATIGGDSGTIDFAYKRE